jgi:hypothetical protein
MGLAWDDFAAVWQPVPEGMAHRGALGERRRFCLE